MKMIHDMKLGEIGSGWHCLWAHWYDLNSSGYVNGKCLFFNNFQKRYFPQAEKKKDVYKEFSNFSSFAADFLLFRLIEYKWVL